MTRTNDCSDAAWLCACGHYIEDGACHCPNCLREAPWGCDCGANDYCEDCHRRIEDCQCYPEFDPYEIEAAERGGQEET